MRIIRWGDMMKLHALATSSASALALALCAAPAFAQADPAPAEDEAAEGEQDIVVTGLRQSLESQQGIRRNSQEIVDAIVAEDIGRLPDIALSDTAARIPGVQVERGGGEAGRVLVRGLPDFATTYNGREIFTAETRLVALQDFPSGGIGAIEVFKTSAADLVEPGLAGLVNVRSRRPFDFDGFEIAGSVWALFPNQSGDVLPNGNLLVTNRWDTAAGEIGVLLNVSMTQFHYLDSTRENTDFVADPTINGQRVRFPDIQRVFYGEGNRTRPSINGAVQWRPSPDVELYVEGLWQGFRNEIEDRLFAAPLWGGQQYTNLAFRDGSNLLSSGTVVNPFRPDGFQGGTLNRTNTYQFAFGGNYDAGSVRLRWDIARTSSRFTGSTASVDYALAAPLTIDFNLDVPRGDGGAEFTPRNFDAANPANYIYRGFYEEAQVAEGDDIQARFDVEYEPGGDFVTLLEAGVRYVDRDAHREFGNRYWNFEGARIPISAVPLDYQLNRAGFRGGGDVQPFRQWLTPTYSSIRENLVALRDFNRARGGTAFGPNTSETVAADPTQTYDANERTTSGYAQLRYEFGDDVTIDGQLGVRVVRTDLTVSGTSRVEQTPGNIVLTPVEVDRSYTDILPNFSMRLRFTPQLQMRFSTTATRTRPNFAQLNPSANLGPLPTGCNTASTDPFQCARRGGGGNPFLDPFTSVNYDASLEYYFRSGFVAASVFRRDLDGFFENLETRYVDPTVGPIIINAPVNSGRGRIDGLEVQFQTFFDFAGLPDWARGFGVQANATYLDAETGFPNAQGGFDADTIVGVSDWAYNLAGFYEGGGLAVRLSYNWRDEFLTTRQNRGNDIYREVARPVGRLDLSASYDVMEAFTIFADWTNILGRPFQSDLISNRDNAGEVTFPRFTRYEETVYSLGVRFRFR